MAKGAQQTQAQTQNSVTQPWAPAQPLLTSLLGDYSGLGTSVTPDQSGALTSLQTAANSIPNFGDTASTGVNQFFNTSTTPQVGMLSSAYDQLKGNLSGMASGANLNPYQTPGFSDALSALTQNITNATKGVYAGSGRDPSGAGSFAGSLARGLTQGEAPVIASQYNSNVGNMLNANQQLEGAANTTAGNITGQQQVPLSNVAQGTQLAGLLSNLYTNPATTQLGAANAAYSQPYGNLSQLLQPATAIAGLGGQTTGTSTGTTSQPQNGLSNAIGGISSGIGLLSFLSDERVKDEVEEVGKLHDGQPVVRFRYKGEPAFRIGLLAQDVAKVAPKAVSTTPVGLLAVDHKLATDRAASMKRAA